MIILNSVQLGVSTYIKNQESVLANINNAFNIFFIAFYSVEMIVRIIAMGFAICKGSYLRNGWFILDFIIIVTSIIDVTLSSSITNNTLQVLRALRPLRIISKNHSMKVMISTLLESITGVAALMIVILFIYLIFSVLGNNLLLGKMSFCLVPPTFPNQDIIYSLSQTNCSSTVPGAVWSTYYQNFDNVFYGLVVMFVITTGENWPVYMFQMMNANSTMPILYANKFLMYLFYFVFTIIGQFYILNMFLGIIFLNYEHVISKSENKILNSAQIQWIKIQKQIVASKPEYVFYAQNTFRRRVQTLCEKEFEYVSLAVTCLNML